MPIVTRGLGSPKSSLTTSGLGLFERVAQLISIADANHAQLVDTVDLLVAHLIAVGDSDHDQFADLVDLLIKSRSKRAKVGTKYISYKASASGTVKVSGKNGAEGTKRTKLDLPHSISIKTDLKRKR